MTSIQITLLEEHTMNAKNIKGWGMSGSTTPSAKRASSTQWIQSSNPHTRIQALSAFKTWYFQQHKNSQ
jgi:hypothetical protein